jgi:hypothetical protein
MSLINSTRRMQTLNQLLKLEAHGVWFLRGELPDYAEEATCKEIYSRLDVMYQKAAIRYGSRSFTPVFKFSTQIKDADTMHPKLYLQLAKRGVHAAQFDVLDTLELELHFNGDHPQLRLKTETPLETHIRENGWKVNPDELKLLHDLVELTNKINNSSKHLKVSTDLLAGGLTIQTNYTNPVDQVRAALAR